MSSILKPCNDSIQYSNMIPYFCILFTKKQIFLVILVQWLLPVEVELYQPSLIEPYVELRCQQSLPGFLTPLSYNCLMIIICAILGYLTRKLPENFNESWHIFISVSTTLFMWLIFLPTYFLAFYNYHQVALLALCLILNSYITLGCLFFPKVYAILFLKEDQIKFSTMTDTSKVYPNYSTTGEPSCSASHVDGNNQSTNQMELHET